MKNHQPIGVFDSGVGGLSVLEGVHRLLPAENLIYVADSAHMPYGSLSVGFVQERCHSIAGFFARHGVKAMIVACNTATAMAVESLRRDFSVPIIGMEPAVKPAAHSTQAGVIGVLATSGTLASEKFSSLLERFGSDAEVLFQPGTGLAEQVESGDFESDEVREILKGHLEPLIGRGIDTLVLGCTHYPFLIPLIRQIVGDDVVILDTGEAIAAELKRQLGAGRLTTTAAKGCINFFSSGDVEDSQRMISRLWGESVVVKPLRR